MSRIVRIRLDEVVVPARPGSINSPETDYPLHKLPYGAQRGWSRQFDVLPKLIIRLELQDGTVGLGETYRAVPLPLAQEVATVLLGLDVEALSLQDLPLPAGRIYDGFECAIVDAYARRHGVPVHALLGGRLRDKVRVAYWTGHRTTADAIQLAQQAWATGFDCIKFKCRLDDPVVDWCAGIGDACGPGLKVVLDPNERFEDAASAGRIADALAPIGNVLYLEDPLPRWDMEEWAHLRARSRVPLAMHVSLPYVEMGQLPQDVPRALRSRACDHFNFNGGVFAVARLNRTADLFGLKYSHGSELDLGVLESSYLHKAAAGRLHVLPSDIFGRLIREHDLLQRPIAIANGEATLPEGPGLGVELDEDALAHYRRNGWSTDA